MNNQCRIVKRDQDNKYEAHLYIGKLHFGVCNDKGDLIKYAKKIFVEQIRANEKGSNLLEKDIQNALGDLDIELNKLKRIN